LISFFFIKKKNQRLRVIFFYLIYSLLADLIINRLLNRIDPFLGFRVYTIIEFGIISYYFYLLFATKNAKVSVSVIAFAFLFFCIYDISTSKSSNFDSVPVAVEAILVIAYCITFFYQQMKKSESFFLYSSSDFWIVVSLLIYFAGTFFVFIYAQKYFGNKNFDTNYEVINSTFLILKNILLVIAFSIKPNNQEYPYIPSK